MPTGIQESTQTTQGIGPGMWTPFHRLSAEEMAVYNKTPKPLGVDYDPYFVASQVVAGVKYCFLCSAKPVIPEADPYVALMYVLLPPKGDPYILEIKQLIP